MMSSAFDFFNHCKSSRKPATIDRRDTFLSAHLLHNSFGNELGLVFLNTSKRNENLNADSNSGSKIGTSGTKGIAAGCFSSGA
jgi:hypothetical protein